MTLFECGRVLVVRCLADEKQPSNQMASEKYISQIAVGRDLAET
jgi:hypothetical protein